MKLLVLVFALLSLLPAAAFARGDMMDRWTLGGYYGISSVNPSDLNDTAAALSTTPALGKITSGSLYGGYIGYMLSPHLNFVASYEEQIASKPTDLTSPSVSGAGFKVTDDIVWAGFNYYLYNNGEVYFYLGALAGYPTSTKLHLTYSTNADYTVDSAIAGRGQAGLGVMLGRHFSIFIQGGYQYVVSGNIKDSSGTVQTVNGHNATVNLSGGRGEAGLAIMF